MASLLHTIIRFFATGRFGRCGSSYALYFVCLVYYGHAMKNKQSALRKLSLASAFLLVLWVCWYNLGGLTVRLWDESRMAVNALEMYDSGRYLVTTFDHQPDLWNTKPPLMIWLQVLSLHLFGIHDWALRIPAALAATATFIAIFHFCYRRLHDFWLGILSVVVLAASFGYIHEHIARTGDFDPLLILWIVLAAFNFFIFLEYHRIRSFYATCAFFGLAVLTKGIAGLMFAPGVLLYTIYRGQLRSVLIGRHTYIGVLLFLLIALPYYFVREYYNAGYLQAVANNELGGRFLKTLEGHDYPWYWYLRFLVFELYVEWTPVALLGLFFLWKERNSGNTTNRGVTYAAILLLTYLTIISIAQTKLQWYIAPVFPFAALVTAYALCFMGKKIYTGQSRGWRAGKYLLPVFLLFALSRNVYVELYTPDHHEQLNDINYYLRDQYTAAKDVKPLLVLAPGYQPHVWWYVRTTARKGLPLSSGSSTDIRPGVRVLVARRDVAMLKGFVVDTMYHTNFIGVFDIKDKKQL